jgi:DNA (cytosine-5)-methyltransferase 1
VNELALFAGAGGGILGGHLLGWRTVCAVEWEPYPASVLCARQNDGLLPPFPIWDDVQTFDGKPWRGIVDVVSGGFPCQDISAAGKGVGIEGERSGMWREMARVVSEVRPKFVFVENSPMLVTRGLERVLGDLTEIGYDTKWLVMGAADIGAPHQRDRIWIFGSDTSFKRCDIGGSNREERQFLYDINRNASESESKRERRLGGIGSIGSDVADTSSQRSQAGSSNTQRRQEGDANQFKYGSDDVAYTSDERDVWREWELGFAQQEHHGGGISFDGSRKWWSAEPNVGRVAHGVAARVDRLKSIGNGQVPLCAATAWRILSD